MLPKRDLTRIVISQGEGLILDSSGKLAGRGAYLCERLSCWESAAHGDALGKVLSYRLTDKDRQVIASHGVEQRPHLINDSIHD